MPGWTGGVGGRRTQRRVRPPFPEQEALGACSQRLRLTPRLSGGLRALGLAALRWARSGPWHGPLGSRPYSKRRPSSREHWGISWVFSSCGSSVVLLTRYNGELREPLLWRQCHREMRAFFSCMPRKFHGWRSLVGPSPWGHKELDMTERLSQMVCVWGGR